MFLYSSRVNTPGSSMTLLSRKHDLRAPPTVQVKSDELQSQLDELDKYIAQLTQNLESTGTGILALYNSEEVRNKGSLRQDFTDDLVFPKGCP